MFQWLRNVENAFYEHSQQEVGKNGNQQRLMCWWNTKYVYGDSSLIIIAGSLKIWILEVVLPLKHKMLILGELFKVSLLAFPIVNYFKSYLSVQNDLVIHN